MPPPRATRVFFQKSPCATYWEVKGDNLADKTRNKNSKNNSNSRPRGRANADANANANANEPALKSTLEGTRMDTSPPTDKSKRPKRRAKLAAIEGLQLAHAEEMRSFSDPEETQAMEVKAPVKSRVKKAARRGTKVKATATSKLDLEAHTDRVGSPPPPPLVTKSKRARTPTRRFVDELEDPVKTRMSPRKIRPSWPGSESEKLTGPKPVYGTTHQPATAASSDTSTDEEDVEEERARHRQLSRQQPSSGSKKSLNERIQRGRSKISEKAALARRQSAGSASTQTEASEQQGRHDEEPAGRIQSAKKNQFLDTHARDSLTLLSRSPERARTKRKKPAPSVENIDQNDKRPDHAPLQDTTDVEPQTEADEMAVANFMVNDLATSDSTQRIIKEKEATDQDPIIQSQEQDAVKESQVVARDQDASVQSQVEDAAMDYQVVACDIKQEEVTDKDASIQSQEQDAAKASQNGQDSPPSYSYPEDPNDYYVEELAYLYHNPPLPTTEGDGVPPEKLRPIPPPPDLPHLPDTGHCKWAWDELSRVLFADFSESAASTLSTMDLIDEKFFLEMLERDDVTVISAGLVSPSTLDHSLWNLDYISQVLNDEYFHKIRHFDTVTVNGVPKCVEKDKMISMKPCDYVQYIRQRRRVLMEPTSEEKEMTFTDHEGREHSINVETTALYMIDLDIGKLLPKMYTNFLESMRMPGVLPGGTHCMMSAITSNARPFMGPNLYITPPASFTHFHQDGHGTVDSGHLCVSGYNEIIILRRLTERHKKHALWLLTGDRKRHDSYFDGLYQEPHGDGLGEKPAWPTNDKIEECKQMGYCPSACILKPGQMIHINKGRLHAFRKLSNHKLPADDCHATLREMLVQEENLEKEQLCISVAWDWMYRGVTAPGINREVCATLECAGLNRRNKKMSLAIPELSLLHMSRSILSEDPLCNKDGDDRKIFGFKLNDEYNKARPYEPSSEEICRGILPGLRHIVKHHVNVMQRSKAKNSNEMATDRVRIMERPNADENPSFFSVDPYGVGDFFCKLCSKELSNVYFHCDGCEKLLSKDFNICEECHSGKKYKQTIQMHPVNNKRHSTINHTGNCRFDRQSRCPCRNGPACKLCGFCSGCSCRCHSHFTLNCRFFNEESEQKLASRLELLLEKKTGSKLPDGGGTHTEQRLSLVT